MCPFASGSVVQSSEPTGCASTKKKSHVGSVSRVTQNDSSPPPAGTVIVRASRLYARSADCEYANRSPVRGATGSNSRGSTASQ